MKAYLLLFCLIITLDGSCLGQTIVSSIGTGRLPNSGVVAVQDSANGTTFSENIYYKYGFSVPANATATTYTIPSSTTPAYSTFPALASTSYLYDPLWIDVPFSPESGAPNSGSSYIPSGTYSLGAGVFFTVGNLVASPTNTITLSNPAHQTLSSTVTGKGRALAFGIYSVSGTNPPRGNGLSHSIYNAGNIQAAVKNFNGEAFGVMARSLNGNISFLNDTGSSITTSASNMANGVYIGDQTYVGTTSVNVVNKGAISGHAYGGQLPEAWGYSYGIYASSYAAAPVFIENDGTITVDTTSTIWSHHQDACGVTGWSNSAGFTFINTGTVTAKSAHNQTLTTASGSTIQSDYSSRGTYFGGGAGPTGQAGGPLMAKNSGAINATEDWALGLEQDCSYPTAVTNSGSINCTYGIGIFIYNSYGITPLTLTNTGTISCGGFSAIAAHGYESNVTINNSGSILNTNGGDAIVLPWTNGVLSNNTVNMVTLTGLPTVQGNMDGGVGTSTLNFQLIGTLQKVNGVTATKGNDLAAYGLGATAAPTNVLDGQGNNVTFIEENGDTANETQKSYPANANGSIQVSGKVYTFSRMSYVVGVIKGSQAPAPVTLYMFHETTGTNTADASGNGFNATLVNGASFGGGIDGNAVALNGSNGYVNLPSGVVSGLQDFTISAWVNLGAEPNWSRIFDFGTGTNTYMFLTPRNGNTGNVRFAITTSGAGGEQIIDGTAPLPMGTWTHVAVTVTKGVGVLYVNGVAVGTNSAMTLNPVSLGITTQNWIGRSQYSGDAYLPGSVDDFRIYSGALTAANVATLASGGASGLISPWSDSDIGLVGATGSAGSPNGNDVTILGSGSDIQGTADAFHYAWQSWSGNGTLTARVVNETPINPWTKAGIMFRQSLDPGASNAFLAITPGNGTTFQSRSSAGAGTAWSNITGLTAPYWLRIVRAGNTFTPYQSVNGVTWVSAGAPVTLAMPTTIDVGLALTAHNTTDSLAVADFDNITLTNP